MKFNDGTIFSRHQYEIGCTRLGAVAFYARNGTQTHAMLCTQFLRKEKRNARDSRAVLV